MSKANDIIDAYLLGQLSEEERQAFEKVLREDPEVAEEYEFRKEMQVGLGEVQREDLRARIKAIGENPPAQQVGRKFPRSRMLMIAASVVLILGASWWYWTAMKPVSGEELFASYYNPNVQIDLPRVPTTGPSLADTLKERYAKEDFSFLRDRLNRLPDSLKNRNLQILEAVTLIELEQDKEAEKLLSSIMEEAIPKYAGEASWLIV